MVLLYSNDHAEVKLMKIGCIRIRHNIALDLFVSQQVLMHTDSSVIISSSGPNMR